MDRENIKKQHSNLKDVFIIFAISFVIFSISFPSYGIEPQLAMFRLNFSEGYTSAQIVVNQFYQGGIQLWARHDQMPYAYYTLTFGIYKIFEVITAIVYACCSPFIWDEAKGFHHIYSFVLMFVSLFLKVAGSYLLLKKFTSSRFVLFASTILLSVYSSFMIVREGVGYQSYYPLGIYLALKVFEDLKLKDICIFITFMLIFGTSSIVEGLYFYCNIHYLLLVALVLSIVQRPEKWKKLLPDLYREFKAHWGMFFLSSA